MAADEWTPSDLLQRFAQWVSAMDAVLSERESLEADAAAQAAQNATSNDRYRLQTLLAGYPQITRKSRDELAPLFRKHDPVFHQGIATAAHNAPLAEHIDDARDRFMTLLADVEPCDLESQLKQHQSIVDAIVAGHPETARLQMRRHIWSTRKGLQRVLVLGLEKNATQLSGPDRVVPEITPPEPEPEQPPW